MADEVSKKDFDALVKRVNAKFAELDKLQKEQDKKFQNLVGSVNESSEDIFGRVKKLTDDVTRDIKTLSEADKTMTENINKTIATFNENDKKLDQRIQKLESDSRRSAPGTS
jgi:uncharacterized phage infection (PIP) family protein YhgE